MLKFIAIYLLFYGLMHALFYVRIKVLLPLAIRGIFIVFLILMMLLPIASRLLERNGHELEAQLAASLGYNWIGFAFLAFVAVVLMTLFDLAAWGINSVSSANFPSLSGRIPAALMLLIVIGLCFYGIKEAKQIRVERLSIETDKLSDDIKLFKIVQISDVHLGLLTKEDKLKEILDIVKTLNPDMLVCTGDLVDGDPKKLFPLSRLFNEITPKYGKYAITGNHEYYMGLEGSLEFLKMSGFTVLRGDVRRTEAGVTIVGVDDPAVIYPQSETALLLSAKHRQFTLLLKHRPTVATESLGLFDLQLSGHTHGGQIFPFKFLVAIQYPMVSGLHQLSKGSRLYINRGTGAWGPRMRILAPPEITLIELKRT